MKRPARTLRPLWVLAGMLVAVAAALAVFVVYLARHPAAVKPLIEKTLSARAGADVRIERLELGTDPLRLDARGIAVATTAAGFQFDAESLTVRASLSGPFGKRILSIDTLRLEEYSGRFTPQLELPARPSDEPPSFMGRLLRRLVRYTLFSDLTVQHFEALNGHLAFDTPTRQAKVFIASIRSGPGGGVRIDANARLQAADKRLRVELPALRVDIAPPGWYTTGPVTGRIQMDDGQIDSDRLAATALTGSAEIGYDPGRREVTVSNLLLQTRMEADFGSAAAGSGVFDASLSADATVRLRPAQVSVSRWSLNCRDLLTLDGSARLEADFPYPFRLQVESGRLDTAGLMRHLPLPYGGRPVPLSVSGPLVLHGDVQGRLAEPPGSWTGSLQSSLDRMPLAVQSGAYRIEGRVGGTLQLSGPFSEPLLQAAVTVADATLAGSPFELAPFEAAVDAAGRFPAYRADLRLRTAWVQLKTGKAPFRLRQVSVSAEGGQIDVQTGEAVFPDVAISSDTLRNLVLTLDRSKQGVKVVLTGSDTQLAAAAASWGLIPADWQFGGSDRIDATVIVDEQQQVLVTSRAAFSGFHSASPDEKTIVDGLQAAADLNMRYQPGQRKWTAIGQLTVDSGEALLDRYYHDFKTHPLTLSGRGTRVSESQRISLDGVRLQLGDLLRLQASGRINSSSSRPTVTATVLVPETELAPLFGNFIREPFKFENPSLEKLTLGGRLSGQLQMAGPNGSWAVLGRLAWNEGRVSFGDRSLAAAGIELDFPVWHPGTDDVGSPLAGSLTLATMQLPLILPQPLHLAFRVDPDGLTTTSPVDIELENGKVQLGIARLESIYSSRPDLATSLSVEAVNLDPLLEKIGGVCPGGLLSGSLDRVALTGHTLTSKGLLVADACGGRIEIRNPGIRNLFSPSAAVHFDGNFEGLDLEQLTAGTSFGRIQGVLNGWVRDLEIVNGQPQAFDLLLETVPSAGVPQKINVRAVENIARLGGGGSPFMGLAGSVVTLFKEFAYSRIGVRASLRNDTFRINGTVREGGKEYLVKKGGLSGVDVVNLNPDNRISFKDMVKRIQRIRQSKSGPVVQ